MLILFNKNESYRKLRQDSSIIYLFYLKTYTYRDLLTYFFGDCNVRHQQVFVVVVYIVFELSLLQKYETKSKKPNFLKTFLHLGVKKIVRLLRGVKIYHYQDKIFILIVESISLYIYMYILRKIIY